MAGKQMQLDKIKELFQLNDTSISWDNTPFAGLEQNQQRYASWEQYAEDNRLYPTEYLLPRIECHCPEDYPSFTNQGKAHNEISDEHLIQAMDELGP